MDHFFAIFWCNLSNNDLKETLLRKTPFLTTKLLNGVLGKILSRTVSQLWDELWVSSYILSVIIRDIFVFVHLWRLKKNIITFKSRVIMIAKDFG